MVTSVYPYNNTTLVQIEGRINRISQNRPEIDYRIVHVGILTSVLRNHQKAKNLQTALESIAKEIRVKK
jgi:hydrogenase maturation factor